MGDVKKKNSWFSWIMIAAALMALIYFFLISVLSKGKNQAEETVVARMTNYVSAWAGQFKYELEDARRYGGIIRETSENRKLDIFSEEVLSMTKLVVKNSSFRSVYVCDNKGKIIDHKGNSHEYSFFEPYLSGAENVGIRYFFIPEDDMGNKNVFVASYPMNKGFLL